MVRTKVLRKWAIPPYANVSARFYLGVDEGAVAGSGAVPTVGQGANKKAGVGKKKTSRPGAAPPGATPNQEKDADGSFRVPGYRGVWVNKTGKHFIMIDGRPIKLDGTLKLFDTTDDAARKHDEILQAESKDPSAKLELNFRSDGTRIQYDDVSQTASSGLGGSAASVVPALSVINIKVSTDQTSRAPLFSVDS
jgi:hypothetical protein